MSLMGNRVRSYSSSMGSTMLTKTVLDYGFIFSSSNIFIKVNSTFKLESGFLKC